MLRQMHDHMVVLYTYCYLDLFLYVGNLVGWKHTNLEHQILIYQELLIYLSVSLSLPFFDFVEVYQYVSPYKLGRDSLHTNYSKIELSIPF